MLSTETTLNSIYLYMVFTVLLTEFTHLGLLTRFMYCSLSHCWTNVLLIMIGFFLASSASDTE